MAEEEKKEEGGSDWILLAGVIICFLLLVRAAARISVWLSGGATTTPEDITRPGEAGTVQVFTNTINILTDQIKNAFLGFSIFEIAPWYVGISLIASTAFLFVTIYSSARYVQIVSEWKRKIGPAKSGHPDVSPEDIGKPTDLMVPAPPERQNERWLHIEELIKSDRESDWRQAILEADILLDEMVTTIGYRGETLSEKLRQVESSDFPYLDEAWEAHKVRNQIAHEGSIFKLDRDLFLQTINQYRRVFGAFNFI